jgi:hypothetical protein
VARRRRPGGIVGATVLVGAPGPGVAACGGSSGSRAAGTSAATAPAPPAIRAPWTATTHAPKVNAPRHELARVTTAAGTPVAAVAHLQATSQGVAVGKIGPHEVSDGVWSETIQWPRASEGQPLMFEVPATALGTTVTTNYPSKVAPA